MRKISVLIALILSISTILQAQEKIRFKLNPKLNEPIKYEMITKIDMSGAQDIMMDMHMDMTLTATMIKDTSIILESKYSRIKMDLDAGLMLVSYDSDAEGQSEMSQTIGAQLEPLLKNNIIIEMGLNGKVKNSKLPDGIGQAFDKSNLENIAANFPENEIKIGDSWNTGQIVAQGSMNSEITNTFIEKTTEGYKIDFKGVILNESANEIGKMTGHYIIDPITFFTKSMVSNGEFEIEGQKIITSTEFKVKP